MCVGDSKVSWKIVSSFSLLSGAWGGVMCSGRWVLDGREGAGDGVRAKWLASG